MRYGSFPLEDSGGRAFPHSGDNSPVRLGKIEEGRTRSRKRRLICVLGGAVLIVAASRYSVSSSARQWGGDVRLHAKSLTLIEKENLPPLLFEAQNKYTVSYGAPGTQYPWIDEKHLIVEPYVPTTLVALAGDLEGVTYSWTVDGQSFEGKSVELQWTKAPSTVEVTLVETDSEGSVRDVSGQLMIRYVKREIRQLDSDDLKATLDTIEVLYRVREAEGVDIYGKGYRDAAYFVRLHNTLAGTKECDHIHDGMGFLTNHVALSLDFERVVRLVNPAVSVPYWDYTIDAIETDAAGNAAPFFKSPVWDDEIFGGFVDSGPEQADNGQHSVVTGRWANIPLSAKFWGADESPVANGWGMLRSPWNMNKSPYLTRGTLNYGFLFDSIPNCKDHYEQMQLRGFTDWGMQIQYKPHGSIHTIIGGAWGADYMNELGDVMPRLVVRDIALRGFGLQKDMWRKGLLSCPVHCGSAAETGEECKCSCPDLDTWLANGEEYSTLRRIGVTDMWLSAGKAGVDVAPTILKMLCNAGGQNPEVGDSMSSAAPIDPTFWVLHPTADRMWQWARLNGLRAEWPDVTYRHEPGTCTGHGLDDTIPWKGLLGEAEHTNFYTNREFYDAVDPTCPGPVNYVYADFKWQHCTEQKGYPEGLIEPLVGEETAATRFR